MEKKLDSKKGDGQPRPRWQYNLVSNAEELDSAWN